MLPELTPEIISKMTDSQKINVQILQSLNSINTRLNDVGHDVAVHEKLLITGNGDPAIPERLRRLEEFMKSFQYWSRFVGGTIILQTIAFLYAVIIAIVRFLPLLEKLANP